jgi:hypothetical protein
MTHRNALGFARAGAAAFALTLLCASGSAAQRFRAPVECTSCISYYYYFDQGSGRDWNCGNATYANHTGSDYSLRNGNNAIDGNHAVVAMAPGMVVHTEDGYFDRCTRCGGTNCGTGIGRGFANQVIINHGPYRVIYGHMKTGSIAVRQGDTVECGQVIGFIGSSGCSTGAHLHIEPSLAENFGRGSYTPLDPYAGNCSRTEPSMFVDQRAHRTLPSPACDDTPAVPACPPNTYPIWTCTEDGMARRRCEAGMVMDEACAYGCTAMPLGTDDVCALPPDQDGDGFRADTDCDDEDPTIHPGAVEVCGDGIDQSCSGADMPCPTPPPPPVTGTAGTTPPPLAGTGGSAPFPTTGEPAPPFGVGGMPAPPFGQAGAAGAVATGWPIPATGRNAEPEGCAVRLPGTGSSSSAALALLACAALLCRRRGAASPATSPKPPI